MRLAEKHAPVRIVRVAKRLPKAEWNRKSTCEVVFVANWAVSVPILVAYAAHADRRGANGAIELAREPGVIEAPPLSQNPAEWTRGLGFRNIVKGSNYHRLPTFQTVVSFVSVIGSAG